MAVEAIRPDLATNPGATRQRDRGVRPEDARVLEVIEHDPHHYFEVVYSTGRLAFRADRSTMRTLVRNRLVRVVMRGAHVRYATLMVPMPVVRRLMQDAEIPSGPHHISTRIQSRGSKSWAPRLDRARTGQMGGQRPVFLDRRLIDGEEAKRHPEAADLPPLPR